MGSKTPVPFHGGRPEQQTLRNSKRWSPFRHEYVETNTAMTLHNTLISEYDMWMVDTRRKCNL